VLIELVDTQEGGSEWLGKRRFPAGGFVRGTRFVVQLICPRRFEPWLCELRD
jgi:hypothetical protein